MWGKAPRQSESWDWLCSGHITVSRLIIMGQLFCYALGQINVSIAHRHTHSHTYTDSLTHTVIHMLTLSHTHWYTHMFTHAHSNMHTHTHTLVKTHTHTHTQTYTHTLESQDIIWARNSSITIPCPQMSINSHAPFDLWTRQMKGQKAEWLT